MRAFMCFIGGIAAVMISIFMAFAGASHVFSFGGFALYYGLVLVLLAGGVLVITVAWSYLP